MTHPVLEERENTANMKDLAAAACSNNDDCLGFNWYKEGYTIAGTGAVDYVVFKSSNDAQTVCAANTCTETEKATRFYAKPSTVRTCRDAVC